MRLPLLQKPSILFQSCLSQLQEPLENCNCNSGSSTLSLLPVAKLTCQDVNGLNEIGGRWMITFRMRSIITIITAPSSGQKAQWRCKKKTMQKCNHSPASCIMAANYIFKRLDREWFFFSHTALMSRSHVLYFGEQSTLPPASARAKRHETAFKTTCVFHILGVPRIL